MRYFIGIDGGGTKTNCILINEKKVIINSISGSGSNPLVFGIKNSVNLLFTLIWNLYLSNQKQTIESIVIALAGAGRARQADAVKKGLQEKLMNEHVQFGSVHVISDAEALLESAFGKNSGAILISGTGSVLFWKNKNGTVNRIGGYGRLVGDEGSGYSLGRRGINAVSKALDKRSKQTILTELLGKRFGMTDRDDLINKVYDENFNIASIAELVINAAEKKDYICRNIIKEEIEELLNHLKALIRISKWKEINLALSGGIAGSNNYFSKELRRSILKAFPQVRIEKIKHTAEFGAALIAKKISE